MLLEPGPLRRVRKQIISDFGTVSLHLNLNLDSMWFLIFYNIFMRIL